MPQKCPKSSSKFIVILPYYKDSMPVKQIGAFRLLFQRLARNHPGRPLRVRGSQHSPALSSPLFFVAFSIRVVILILELPAIGEVMAFFAPASIALAGIFLKKPS